MMRRPFKWRKQYTNAPTGHSTHAATAKATKPRVGPRIRQWQGLRRVPHSKHNGTNGQHGGSAEPAAWAVTVFILLNELTQNSIRIVSKKFTNGRCKEAGDCVGDCSKLEVDEMQR